MVSININLDDIKAPKKFIKLYEQATKLINIPVAKTSNESKMAILHYLHEASPYLKHKKDYSSLRMCRFYEAEFQEIINFYPELFLQSWLSVAYIDTWGIYLNISNYDEYERERLDVKEWTIPEIPIAPYVIRKIIKCNKSIDEIERTYKNIVIREIKHVISYKPPITDEQSWDILKKQLML